MKVTTYSIVLMLLLFPIVVTAQVKISGTVTNYDNDFILIGKVSNYELLHHFDTITLNNSSFSKELKITKPTVINVDFTTPLSNDFLQRIAIFVTPNEQINFDIDFLKKHNGYPTCSFSGNNALGHQLFYTYEYYPLGYHTEGIKQLIREETTGKSGFNRFLVEIEKFISPYDSLYQRALISEDYFQFITDYIKAGITSSIIYSLGRKGSKEFYSSMNENERRALIRLLLAYSPKFSNAKMLVGRLFSSLVHNFSSEQNIDKVLLNFGRIGMDTITTKSGKKLPIENSFAISLSIEDDLLKEYFIAFQLHQYFQIFLGGLRKFDEEYAFFKELYPDSKYLSILEKDRIRNDVASSSMGQTSPIENEKIQYQYFEQWIPTILENSNKIESFNFQNEKVNLSEGILYIDIWATWCKPCLEEIEYNYKADSLLEANNIERLYISIDDSTSYNNWANTIHDLHLGGYHVLANEKLRKYLFQNFGNGFDSMVIPRYLFVKKGKVINSRASRPSEFEQLEKQVKQLKY